MGKTTESIGVSIAMLCALFSTASVATEPSVAVIAADNCDQMSTVVHARNYREALAPRMAAEVLSEADTISRLGGNPRSSVSLAEIERLLSGAKADVFQDQVERASRTLIGVVEDVERLPPSPARYLAFTDVLAVLGHIQLLRGKAGETDAATYFSRILRVDPNWSPNVNLYRPTTRAFVAQLRSSLQKQAKLALKITTRPTGLMVYVDTKPLGPSPQTVELLPDSYAIDVGWTNERRGLPRRIKLQQPAEIELDRAFDGAVFSDRACAQSDGTREGRLALATRLAGVLNVGTVHVVREDELSQQERFLTVVTVSNRGEELLEARIRVHAGTLTSVVFENLVRFMVTGESPAPPVEPIRGTLKNQIAAAPVAAALDSTRPRSRSQVGAWISGAIAVGLAGGSAAFIFATSESSRRMAQVCPGTCSDVVAASQYASFRTTRDSQFGAAIGLGIATGVAIVTTVVFIVLRAVSDDVPIPAASTGPAAVSLRF